MSAQPPVIAIGLDAGDRALIGRWIAAGELPVLADLKRRGHWGELENFATYPAETPWTTFLTGCRREQTGYWSPLRYDPQAYDFDEQGAYDYREFPPFYAHAKGKRIAVIDVPQVPPRADVEGVQLVGWGAHSPQVGTASLPAEFLAEVQEKFGPHPALHDDDQEPWQDKEIAWLEDALLTGIERRADICCDLLARERWDLLVTVFGETHSGGHVLLHLSDRSHPLAELTTAPAHDPLLALYKAIDSAIGRIVAAAPEAARIAVFSTHGMAHNNMDVPGMCLLPEALARWNFPGETAMDYASESLDPVRPADLWTKSIWSHRHRPGALRRLLRKSPALERLGDALLGAAPAKLRIEYDRLPYIPASWYRRSWPKMKAFALPTFSDGHIRINLKGRDAQGQVAPEDYGRTCDELVALLEGLTDPRTGEKAVREVIRTRQDPTSRDPKLPDADLVIRWTATPLDMVEGPGIGRIGPVPHRRSGGHVPVGWYVVAGPGLEPGAGDDGHAVDLAPTLLALMGETPPPYMPGKPLLRDRRRAIAAA